MDVVDSKHVCADEAKTPLSPVRDLGDNFAHVALTLG